MHGITSAMLTIESLQPGEAFILCQGNALGSMGTCTLPQGSGSLTDTIPISWGASTDMFAIQGAQQPGFTPPVVGPDVLIQGITFTPPPVPEPASLLLFGSGLVALAVRKRSRNNKPITTA
jgi:PEP-CTERM motif